MATRWADDFDAIGERLKKIREYDDQPKCPRSPERLLHTCLRSTVRCSTECPLYHDWIGPNE